MINERNKKNKNINENTDLNVINYQNKSHSRNRGDDLKNYQNETDGGKLTSTGEDKYLFSNSKNDLMTLFKDKIDNKKNQNISDILINYSDNNEKSTTNNLSTSSNSKKKSKIPASRALSSLMFNQYIYMNNINNTKKKKIKKVTFKKKIVDIIEIESFKKYNLENGFNTGDRTDAKCSCFVL